MADEREDREEERLASPDEPVVGAPLALPGRRYLVLWSGGLDSTWSLHALLTRTDAEVFAHHVVKRSRTDDGRALSEGWRYELNAVRRMRPWLAARVRGFAYSESMIDLTAFPNFSRDTITALFLASQAAKSWRLGPRDALVLGGNADDDRLNDPAPELYWRSAFRNLLSRQLVQAAMQEVRVPEIVTLLPAPTRAQQVANLPDELTAMTASCRNPRRDSGPEPAFRPCGACTTCRALAAHLPIYAATRETEGGTTPGTSDPDRSMA